MNELNIKDVIVKKIKMATKKRKQKLENKLQLKKREDKKIKYPPRFLLMPEGDYNSWLSHRRRLHTAEHVVDNDAPNLLPELYFRPSQMKAYLNQHRTITTANGQLLRRINIINREGGAVDCWRDLVKFEDNQRSSYKKRCVEREEILHWINRSNKAIYKRLVTAKSEMLTTKELDEEWIKTKLKFINTANLPFVLFDMRAIDCGMRDPLFDCPPGVRRPRVRMEFWLEDRSKLGRAIVELFTDICPCTCDLFMNLLKGDGFGHSYNETRVFRIIPELYCRCGDITKNNGYGCYVSPDQEIPLIVENFYLKHSVPGVLSMAVTEDNEVCGHFNIIFKPLPQLDGQNVVFGRMVGGAPDVLTRISANGSPLGYTREKVMVRNCQWKNKKKWKDGDKNTAILSAF